MTLIFATLLITLLTLTIATIVIYFKRAFTYWKRKGVPSPIPRIPFGTATNIILQKSTFAEELKNIYEEYKNKGFKYAGFYFLTRPVLLVFDPELIKHILVKDFEHFSDHGTYLNEESDPLTGNLLCLKGLKWKNLRAKLTPTFTSGKMKMMFQTLLDCTNEIKNVMNKTVESNECIDIKETVGRITTDIIGSCAFAIECNSLNNPNSEFRKYGKKVFEVEGVQAIKCFLSLCFPSILHFFNAALIQKDVTNFFMGVVKEAVDYRETNNIIRKDFMHLLIQLRNNVEIRDEDDVGSIRQTGITSKSEIGKSLTMSELAAQAFVFFLAGFETSSTALTFCFYELVANLDVQEELRKEIKDILGKYNDKLTYEAMVEMTYMDKCISEAFRKHPPSSFLRRECSKAYTFPATDLTIEKGTMVLLPTFGIHRDPKYYPNPEKFDPERFNPENKAKRPPFTWLPFGGGPRICIGYRFAWMQMKVVLAVLLKDYKFTLNPKTETPLVLNPKNFLLGIRGGLWLNVEKV
ncbi:hypothetical protein ILUMI_00104 [Ignelater luminosus]|uniref:Cytochrome P450 n=1 Tax=Ignelater luminosus TaxID=2038154 RepID=A0A8K0DM97_IGNLU|nr:hypothetical protein ILUMI_00104 [Ignelater luminosus]